MSEQEIRTLALQHAAQLGHADVTSLIASAEKLAEFISGRSPKR